MKHPKRSNTPRAPWLGIFARLVFNSVALHVAVTLLVSLTLFFAIDLVEMSGILPPEAGFMDVLRLEVMNLPVVIQQVAGVVVLIGATTGIAALLRRGEIVAVLSAGASPSSVLKPVIVFGILVALTFAILTEWVVPESRTAAVQLRRELGLPTRRADAIQSGKAWFRGRDRIFRIEDLQNSQGTVLVGVLMLEIQGGQVRQRWDIKNVHYEDGVWTGHGVLHRVLTDDGLKTALTATTTLAIQEAPEDFVRSLAEPERLAYFPLLRSLHARERLGQTSRAHRTEWLRRHSIPLILLLSIVVGAGVALLANRKPSLASSLGLGGALGFALWTVDETCLALGNTGALSPTAATLASLVAAFALAVMVWRRVHSRGLRPS